MARLITPSGWGTLRDPETGDRVSVTDDLDDEVAERLADHYAEAEATDLGEEGDDAPSEEDDTDPDEDDGDEEDICGVVMSDGSVCERPADECPYHG